MPPKAAFLFKSLINDFYNRSISKNKKVGKESYWNLGLMEKNFFCVYFLLLFCFWNLLDVILKSIREEKKKNLSDVFLKSIREKRKIFLCFYFLLLFCFWNLLDVFLKSIREEKKKNLSDVYFKSIREKRKRYCIMKSLR